MDEDNLRNLGFERVHSNFEYFDDGTFNNLSPFTDIDSLMGEVSNFISWYHYVYEVFKSNKKDKYYQDEISKQAKRAFRAFA